MLQMFKAAGQSLRELLLLPRTIFLVHLYLFFGGQKIVTGLIALFILFIYSFIY